MPDESLLKLFFKGQNDLGLPMSMIHVKVYDKPKC